MALTPAELIENYLKLRNKIEQIQSKHKDELEPYISLRQQLETALLDYLNKTNLQSVNGAGGTAYKLLSTSVTVKDWAKTLEYIRANDQWELLEARVSKTAVLEILEENKETKKSIPGVQVAQAFVVRVRTV